MVWFIQKVIPTLHGTSRVIEGVVAYLSGCECLDGQVRDPVTYLVIMISDEAILLSVEGMSDDESNPAAVAVVGKVRVFNVVLE